MIKKILLLLSLISPLLGNGNSKKKIIHKTINVIPKLSKPASTILVPRITVWIHGTKGLGTISDHIHATGQQGLTHYSTVQSSYRIGSIIKTLIDTDSLHFPSEHFYVFGWSGKLCFNERALQAQKLYQALQLLVQQYETKYGVYPHITLITHSHGGNVALNLSTLYDLKNPLVISQLVLLACPVQHETEHLIAHDMFKKAYSLYSTADMIQILDPQGMYLTKKNQNRHLELSNRKFPLYPNVRQTKLKINGHGIMHVGFITKSFMKMLPQIIDGVEQWHIEESASGCAHERELRIKTSR